MLKKLLIRSLLIGCFIQFVSATKKQCQVDCSWKSDGDKVPDPYNCNNFYFCQGHDKIYENSIECPTGQYFDYEGTQDCATEDSTNPCKSICDHPPVPCPTATDCSNPDTNTFPSENDCTVYYWCDLQRDPVPVLCIAPELNYNGETCVNDENQCCIYGSCTPYCTEDDEGSTVADPCSCDFFYICDKANKIPEFKGSCQDGKMYSSATNECEDPTTTVCAPTCSAPSCS